MHVLAEKPSSVSILIFLEHRAGIERAAVDIKNPLLHTGRHTHTHKQDKARRLYSHTL